MQSADLAKVVHVDSFFKEIEAVEKLGVNTKGRIFISDRCHVVLDLHQSVSLLQHGNGNVKANVNLDRRPRGG